MTVLRLFIPGRFEDAQLYMGHLVVFSDERDVCMLELQPFTERLEDSYSEWKGIATAAFARNDWLASAQIKNLMCSPDLAALWSSALQRVAPEPLAPEIGTALEPLRGFEIEASVLLDSNLYGGRLYLGADSGLFHFDIDWREHRIDAYRQRTDARCVDISAAWGTLNASCESAGLLTAYDEFGWASHLAEGGTLEHTADISLRTAWLGHDLVNYADNHQADLLSGTVERVEDQIARTPTRHELITQISDEPLELKFLFAALENGEAIPPAEIQFLWNSSRAFFVNTYSHGFFTLIWDKVKNRVNARHHGEAPGRVVAVHPFSGGWLIETDFMLLQFTDGELTPLFEQEPLMVRTFTGSKRYRELVAVTAEDGLHLISVIDPP